jgi:hypothetical protein
MRKSAKMGIGIVVGIVWLSFAIGFMYFGLIGFFSKATQNGFRNTLCGSAGCSDLNFILTVLWLAGMILITYIMPIAIIILLILRMRRKN